MNTPSFRLTQFVAKIPTLKLFLYVLLLCLYKRFGACAIKKAKSLHSPLLSFPPSASEHSAVSILIHAVCTALAHSVQTVCSCAKKKTPVPVHKGPAKPWEDRQATTEGCDVNTKVRLEDGVSAAKSVCRSCRGPEFSSITHTRRFQSAKTPAPGDLTPYSGLLMCIHTDTDT